MTAAIHPWRNGSRRTAEQIKAEGWREQGIFAVSMDDDRLDAFERQFLTNLGNKLYGKPGSMLISTGTRR